MKKVILTAIHHFHIIAVESDTSCVENLIGIVKEVFCVCMKTFLDITFLVLLLKCLHDKVYIQDLHCGFFPGKSRKLLICSLVYVSIGSY